MAAKIGNRRSPSVSSLELSLPESTKNLRRDNHFLPTCYQRGFADANGKVWVKETDNTEPLLRKAGKVGKKRNFYIRTIDGVQNDAIEIFFGKAVETAFTDVSRKIKEHPEEIDLSGTESGVLARFVAAQTVRTDAHRRCIDQQAGRPVDRDTYLNVMTRQMWTITKAWGESLPNAQFLTTLPYVAHQFITGDCPVLVFTSKQSAVLTPTVEATRTITPLPEILGSSQSEFVMTLTPYVAVRLGHFGPNEPSTRPYPLDPEVVLKLNRHIRDQSSLFTLARYKESL
jgi:hypothetical protein